MNSPTDPASPDPAAGWDAITAACTKVHPDQREPLHYGTLIRWSLGGPDPLDGISVYRSGDPLPHWHYVSYGLTDLYSDEPVPVDDDLRSGFGFELTFRLGDPAAVDPSAAPPVWPMNLMQNLARYVVTSGNTFGPGHHLDVRGPIAADSDTTLTAVVFSIDPELGELDTRRGRMSFLLFEGITAEEVAGLRSWSSDGLLGLLRDRHPGGVTVLGRGSITAEPEVADAIAAGAARDGSQQGLIGLQSMTVEDRSVSVTAPAVTQLLGALAGRIPYGRPLVLQAPGASVSFLPSATRGLEIDGPDLTVQVSPASLAELGRLLIAEPGTYRAVGVTWIVTD